MKIYTRKGDDGTTSLYSGRRVRKNHPRVNTYGTIDELNSLLGVALGKLLPCHPDPDVTSGEGSQSKIGDFIRQVQKDLFLIGSSIAGTSSKLDILPARVKEMEKFIDKLERGLPKLANFIFYRGTESAALLFLGRAVARRVERELVSLSAKETIDRKALVYFNRLSDLLFIMARYMNYKAGVKEEIWKGK